MPLPWNRTSNQFDFRCWVSQKFQSLLQGLARGVASLRERLKMNGYATRANSKNHRSAETTAELAKTAAKRPKVVSSPISKDLSKIPAKFAAAAAGPKKASSSSSSGQASASASKGSAESRKTAVVTRVSGDNLKVGGSGRVSVSASASKGKVIESKEKVVVAPKVSVSASTSASASRGCVESSKVKATETPTMVKKPALPRRPATRAEKGKEKMETPPMTTRARASVQSPPVEKLNLGGGTRQKATFPVSKLKVVNTSSVKVSSPARRVKTAVVAPSTTGISAGNKPSSSRQQLKKKLEELEKLKKALLAEKLKALHEEASEGRTFYLQWDVQGFADELVDDSKLGQDCLICEKDLSYAPVPPETDMGTNNFPEAAVLPCGHVFHLVCLETACGDHTDQPAEPLCFMCASLS